MAGYDGWSMSNNARLAYSEGLKPLSKWTKTAIIERAAELAEDEGLLLDIEQLKKLNLYTLKDLLVSTEWHHTGSFYQETDFYDVSLYELKNLIQDGYKNKKAPAKEKKEWEQGYFHGEWTEKIFHPYSRHNKCETHTYSFQNARKKGDWLYFENGTRHSVTNCRIQKHTKIRLSKQRNYER